MDISTLEMDGPEDPSLIGTRSEDNRKSLIGNVDCNNFEHVNKSSKPTDLG